MIIAFEEKRATLKGIRIIKREKKRYFKIMKVGKLVRIGVEQARMFYHLIMMP